MGARYFCALTRFYALPSDFDFYCSDKDVSYPVQPPEGGTSVSHTVASGHHDVGEFDAEVDTVDQVTVTGHGACYFLTPVGL